MNDLNRFINTFKNLKEEVYEDCPGYIYLLDESGKILFQFEKIENYINLDPTDPTISKKDSGFLWVEWNIWKKLEEEFGLNDREINKLFRNIFKEKFGKFKMGSNPLQCKFN